jgi:hypothetical protein
MADGISAAMGCVQSWICGVASSASNDSEGGQIDANAKERRPGEVLSILRHENATTDDRREAGGLVGVCQEGVLQQDVHGQCHGGEDQGDERAGNPPTVSQDSEPALRGLRSDGSEVACSPQGREWLEQQRRQFDYIVRSMPSTLALAELYGLRHEAEALLALRAAIVQEGSVLEASATIQEIWQSLPDEAQTRLAVRFGGRAGIVVPSEPLAYGIPVKLGPSLAGIRQLAKSARRNRVGRLRGYGNAIVPQVAAEFISACAESMREYLTQRQT